MTAIENPLQRLTTAVKRLFFRKKKQTATHLPTLIPRDAHTISRKYISKHALKVLYQLHDAGFKAYLVGGCVRDLLLGREPKDFDVVTNAKPEQVRALFRSALIIGRRFRLVHVRFYGEIIEVATFRGAAFVTEGIPQQNEHGMLVHDNEYGRIEDDAIRRDFTINALYYNIADFSVVDYMGGIQDLNAGLLRMIGEPLARFREDPVRILRVIRFAAKLGFHIEKETAAAIPASAPLLTHVSSARLFDEITKLFFSGNALKTFHLLKDQDLLRYLLPHTTLALEHPERHQEIALFIDTMLEQTDARILADKGVNPAFLYAAMLWYPCQLEVQKRLSTTEHRYQAYEEASQSVINAQMKSIAIPRRLIGILREIWQMQFQLEKRAPSRVLSLVYLQRFRASYDFLLLRAVALPKLAPLADWWTRFYEGDEDQRAEMITLLRQKRQASKTKKKPAQPLPE